MAEAEHAALAEQDVVGQAGDDRDADLRQHRLREARAPQQRRDQQHERKGAPHDPVAALQVFG